MSKPLSPDLGPIKNSSGEIDRDREDDLDARPVAVQPKRTGPMRWICLVHGAVSCRCKSKDMAPWGGGEFHRWSRPRATDTTKTGEPWGKK